MSFQTENFKIVCISRRASFSSVNLPRPSTTEKAETILPIITTESMEQVRSVLREHSSMMFENISKQMGWVTGTFCLNFIFCLICAHSQATWGSRVTKSFLIYSCAVHSRIYYYREIPTHSSPLRITTEKNHLIFYNQSSIGFQTGFLALFAVPPRGSFLRGCNYKWKWGIIVSY